MKLLLASVLALSVVLSGCKSSNPPPAPEAAQGGPSAQAVPALPRDAGAPPLRDAGLPADAGSTHDAGSEADGGSAEPAGDAGTQEASAEPEAGDGVPTDGLAAKLLARGCSFDPGSEALRVLASESEDGEKRAGAEDYQESFDCAPASEFDQNCAYDPCWAPMERCKETCGTTCDDCKRECQPTCVTCMSGCETDACEGACAETTESCLRGCQAPRMNCRDACESTYRECSKAAQEHWERECAGPCEENTDCERQCAEKPGKQGLEACKAKCPAVPDACADDCAFRQQ